MRQRSIEIAAADLHFQTGPIDGYIVIYNYLVVNRLDATFAALADPTRRRILERLGKGPATVNELASPFSMSQQAVSKHLAYLVRARLVRKRREGRQHFCSLEAGAIREVSEWAEGYRRFWQESFQRLDEYLRNMKEGEEI
jgi:DNA-binding transcriptional ArsR family regulator